MNLISSSVKPRKSGRLQKRCLGDPMGVTQSGSQRDEAEIRVIHPASRGGAAHTAGFFGQLKNIYKKLGKNIVFSVFLQCVPSKTP